MPPMPSRIARHCPEPVQEAHDEDNFVAHRVDHDPR
jgi:hypothetical protein